MHVLILISSCPDLRNNRLRPKGRDQYAAQSLNRGTVKILAHFPTAPWARHPVRLLVQQRHVQVAAGVALAPRRRTSASRSRAWSSSSLIESRQLESYRGGPCPPSNLDAIPLPKCARNCTLPRSSRSIWASDNFLVQEHMTCLQTSNALSFPARQLNM